MKACLRGRGAVEEIPDIVRAEEIRSLRVCDCGGGVAGENGFGVEEEQDAQADEDADEEIRDEEKPQGQIVRGRGRDEVLNRGGRGAPREEARLSS